MIEPLKSSPANVNFGKKSIIKTLYEAGVVDLKKDIYGGKLSRDKDSIFADTLEHIRPKSKKGPTGLANLAIASKANNNARSNKPLSSMFSKSAFDEYCDAFKGVKYFQNSYSFNGDSYVEELTHTVKNELRNEGRLDLFA